MHIIKQLMEQLINTSGPAPIFNTTVFLHSEQAGQFNFQYSTNEQNQDSIQFKIASITKLFTATLLLQYAEQNNLSLDTTFFELLNPKQQKDCANLLIINNLDYSSSITLKQLLSHRSGLADYVSDIPDFLSNILINPDKNWTATQILNLYKQQGLAQKLQCKPGHAFHYSDTNYLLLALVLENLSQQPFHELLRKQIFTPLSMENSYLEFFETATGKAVFTSQHYGQHTLNEINTSFDWGGGGIVSTVPDLHKFIQALFTGKLFKNPDTLDNMLQIPLEHTADAYALGVQELSIKGQKWFGHRSAYGAAIFYNQATQTTIFTAVNQAIALGKSELLLAKTIKLFQKNLITI